MRLNPGKWIVEKYRRKPAAWWITGACVGILLFFIVQGAWIYYSLDRPVPRPPVPVLVRIEKGWPAARIADAVYEKGLVTSPTQFVLAARAEGVTTSLRAGTFLIRPGHSPRSLARFLSAAPTLGPRLRIPEGSTASQVVALLQAREISGATEAANLITSATFIGRLGLNVPSLEGFLYPDTYEYDQDTTAEELLARMVARLRHVAAELDLGGSASSLRERGLVPLRPHEVVTLASIIEREAGPQEDKEKVSRVFHNRLLLDMRLESCATIRRAIDNWQRPLTLADLRVDSPYNTYKIKGLPEKPICNPGKGSLRAALYPAPGDVLFFVARGDGTNYFSSTYEDHLKAKEKYLGSP
jgi:UPF0755 protein